MEFSIDNNINAFDVFFNHSVHSISTATADSDDFDYCAVIDIIINWEFHILFLPGWINQVTGETPAARQMVVEQETTNTYESYEAPEETVYDEPEPKESGENVKNKIKGFFTNIFD